MRCNLSQLCAITSFLPGLLMAQINVSSQNPPLTPPSNNTPPDQRCVVAGRATNAQTGEPLKKVMLRLTLSPTRSAATTANHTGAQGYATSSEADGSFHFDGVEPGSYRLSAERTGFLEYSYGANTLHSPGKILTLAPAQQLTNLNIALTRQAVISGKVLDEDGDPVPDVSVQVLTARWTHGKLQYMPFGSDSTNDLGEFRISHLGPGKYYLYAEEQNWTRQQQAANIPAKADLRPVRTYYPDALTRATATPIEIRAGQDAPGMDIRFHVAATYHVRGKVAGAIPEGDAERMIISLAPRDDEVLGFFFGGQSMIQKDLSFDIPGVAAGSYNLNIFKMGGPMRVLARQPVDVGASDLTGLVVNLIPPISLRGQIRVESTPPAGGSHVNLSTVHVSLTPAERGGMFGGTGNITVKPDGSFTVDDLFPSKYYLRVARTEEGTYLKSIRLGQEEVLGKALDLSQGAPGELDVLLRYGPAEVDGTVTTPDNPDPAANPQGSAQTLTSPATVVLVPNVPDADGSALWQSTADANGNFSVKQVPPGHYRAYAFEQVEYELLQNPDILTQLQSKATELELKENEKKQIQLTAISVEEFQQLLARLGIDQQ